MINLSKIFKDIKSSSKKLTIPLLPLKNMVVFPYKFAPLFVERAASVHALANALNNNKRVFLSLQKKTDIDNPKAKDIHTIGTVGSVLQILRLPNGMVKVLIEGKHRAKIVNFIEGKDFAMVEVEDLPIPEISMTEQTALIRTVIESLKKYGKLNKDISKDVIANVASVTEPSQLADIVSAEFSFKIEDKQRLLEIASPAQRLNLLIKLIKMETDVFKMEQRIKGRVKEQIDKSQKSYYLNEQIRAIKKEMGAGADSSADELKSFEKQIKRKRMSKEAVHKVKQEFKKLKMMPPMSAEANVVRSYIEWIISLPWFKKTKISIDIENAEKILNEDHYGLEKPKERILEYLAVQSLVKKIKGPILCLVGPPGVGKTSLAKSVARATERKFVRLSLGGVRDEAEIRGHRRTYVGAMPGKIIQSLKKVSVNNPVFCLDEVDKMSMDFRGDPSSALLEVLDPEQNYSFNDHYLDVDYDLADILFITTANTLQDIPLPLQDRMEVIRLSSYTELEKYNIAKDWLIPKQLKANGLCDKNIEFSKNATFAIIQKYTREAGVRNLERKISAVMRKLARKIVKNKDQGDDSFKITEESLLTYLGQPRFKHGSAETRDQIGVVTGLAWTQTGGELLCVETLIMSGKGKLIMTGKLGDVMQESAKAAVSYIRSRAEQLKIDGDFYKKFDIHIHVPEGAISKDGPSAGISMCTSIVSALIKKPVSHNIAMTGEITLRGNILPIGGLKEKILAAHRGKIKKVIIPKENEKDIEDIPSNILEKMEIIPVEQMDEVLSNALISNNDSTEVSASTNQEP